MRRIIWVGIGLWVGFLVMSGQGDFVPVPDQQAVSEKLAAMSGRLESIQSDFVQEKHMSFLDMQVVSKGKFWFQKENSLRWEYTDPFTYIVVVNDGKLTIVNEGKNNEMKMKGNRMFAHVNDIIVASVKGQIMDTDDFQVSLFENQHAYFVKLITLNPDIAGVIEEMHMYFDKATFSVARIVMNEPNGDYTSIRFENRKVNEPIPASVFIVE